MDFRHIRIRVTKLILISKATKQTLYLKNTVYFSFLSVRTTQTQHYKVLKMQILLGLFFLRPQLLHCQLQLQISTFFSQCHRLFSNVIIFSQSCNTFDSFTEYQKQEVLLYIQLDQKQHILFVLNYPAIIRLTFKHLVYNFRTLI